MSFAISTEDEGTVIEGNLSVQPKEGSTNASLEVLHTIYSNKLNEYNPGYGIHVLNTQNVTGNTSASIVLYGGSKFKKEISLESYIDIGGITTPSNPSSAFSRMFFNTTGNILQTLDTTGKLSSLNPLTTKGDLIVHNGTTENRLPIGNNGQVLRANTAVAAGMEWNDFDHGSLLGLNDDDHTQYLLLGGRSGGQVAIGGINALDNLILNSTSNITKGQVLITETTESSSTTSGAFQVNGGIGVGGNVYVGNTLAVDNITENNIGNGLNINDLKYTTLKVQSEPPSPSVNQEVLYIDIIDHKVKSKNSNGNITTYQPTTIKGDILVHNGTTQVRLPIGQDGYSLVADDNEETGVRWACQPPEFFVKSVAYFQNNDFGIPVTIQDMSILPGIAGNYQVDYNGQYNTQLQDITAQAVLDLNTLHSNLVGTATTGSFPVITSGSTVTPGVYSQAAAIGFTGTLTFDGLNNHNSIFIFRTEGAITAAAGVTFTLINDAKADNIYFIAIGAIGIGATVSMSGVFISSAGAVSLGAGSFLTGKLLSKLGAISSSGNIIKTIESFPYEMGVIHKFVMFSSSGAISNVGSNIIVGDVGTNNGIITGFNIVTFTGNIYLPGQGSSLITFGIYIDDTLVPGSERERVDYVQIEDVVMADVIGITDTETISIKVVNDIGISRFYNRILTLRKLCDSAVANTLGNLSNIDNINELTVGNGVTIEGVNIRDSYITLDGINTPTGFPDVTEARFYLDSSDGLLKSIDSFGIITTYQPLNLKGDILTHNGNTQDRLPVGADTYILTADSSESTGLKWIVNTGGGGGGGGGETNTASNVGTGIGVFKQKTVNNLEFKSINAGSTKISVVDDTGNNEIDIDVNEGNIVHQNLLGAGTNTHSQIDSHISSTSNPHSVTIDQITPTTTKGDLLVEDGSNVVRVPIGTNGQVLLADNTESTGVRWGTNLNLLSITNTTISVSTSTGSLIVSGGTGISGALHVGQGIVSNFDTNQFGILSTTSSGVGIGITNPARLFHVQGSNAIWRLDRDTNSTALQLHRFPPGNFTTPWKGFIVGVDASGVNDGTFFINDYSTNVSGPSTPRFIIGSTGNIGISQSNPQFNLDVSGTTRITGIVTLTSNTSSGSTTTGSLVVTGGIGVSGNLNIGGQITSSITTGTAPFVVASTTNVPNLNASTLSGATFASPGAIGSSIAGSGAFTTISASNIVTFTNTTESTTTSNGSLILSGGLGVQKNVNIGGNIFTSGFMEMGLITTPSLPTSGFIKIFYNTSGNFITSIDSSGKLSTLNPLVSKGDLLTHNGNTESRLPVGTNGNVISANSAQANGVEWTNVNSLVTTLVAIIRDVKSQGTNGGTFSTGAWRIRDLNNLSGNANSRVSLSSNQFTLQPGKYFIHASAPANDVDEHQTRIFNVTTSSVESYGMVNISGNASMQIASMVSCYVDLSSSTVFRLEHRNGQNENNTGFGAAAGWGDEVYSIVNIQVLN
jgi:hypothetical protein